MVNPRTCRRVSARILELPPRRVIYLLIATIAGLALASTPGFAAASCPLSSVSPSVTICSPAANSTVASPVHVNAGTTDSSAISYMQVYLDGVKVYEQVSVSSIDTYLSVSAATHRLTVQAKDAAGNLFKSTIYFTATAGTGGSGTVTLSPSSLTFPSEPVGTTSPAQTATLSNGTASAISITAVTTSGDFHLASDGCGTSLAAGASCTVSITFTPTAAGTRTGTLAISDSAGTQSTSLTGTGGTSSTGGVTVSPTSLNFGSVAVGTTSSAQSVVLTNGTTSAITVKGAGITAPFAIASFGCGTTLAAGASCTTTIVFKPTATGTFTGTFSIGDSAGNQSVSLTGTGGTTTGGSVTLSPASLTFASQAVGTTSAAQAATLSNTTASAISITSVTTSGDFHVASNGCGSSLAAGASCTVSVTFTPTASGTRTGSLAVTDSAGTQSTSLNGTGASSTSGVTLSPTSLSFGSQAVGTASSAQSVVLTNGTSSAITVKGAGITAPFAISSFGCGTTLAAGASCTTTIVLKPTANGTFAGTFTIGDSAGNQSVSLTGTGGTGGSVTLNPNSLTFGSQTVGTTSSPLNTILQNGTSAAISISSITTSGDFAVASNGCGSSLAAGANCTIAVDFKPTASGTRTGTLTVTDSAGTQTANLAGTGASSSGSITVKPRATTLYPGEAWQFSASVSGVTWAVDGITGGSSTSGTISTGGLYTAGSATGAHTVTATSGSSSGSATAYISTVAGVYTRQYDNARTGQNLSEVALSPSNVNSAQFGKLCSYTTDSYAQAEPLYVANVNLGTKGTHSVVYVATMHDSVYAFDAECRTASAYWQVTTLGSGETTVPGSAVGSTIEYGIVPTPVIDPSSSTIYVLARSVDSSGVYHQRLHALDLATGAEKFGGPVEVTASVPGTGDGSSGGTLAFNPLRENSRPGMLLLNGVVYMAFASISDISPYHGWVIGYSASTLQRVSVWVSTPNGHAGGTWMSGAGIAADGNGTIFTATGNGTFDANSGGKDYGDSFVRLSTANSALSLTDYFTPDNQATLNTNDLDLASGGVLLPPTQSGSFPNILIGAGKEGTIYVINRDNMGHFNSTSNAAAVQTISGAIAPLYGAPAYWNGNVYLGGNGDNLKAFSLSNGQLSGTPTSMSPTTYGFPGTTPAISANGNNNAIVWAMERNTYTVLHAYEATNLGNEILTSNTGGLTSKFYTPLVVNGRVYLGCNGSLVIYGLLP
jgi:hypothetical protein